MLNELKQLRRHHQRISKSHEPESYRANVHKVFAKELDAIIHKYEEPTEAMLDAGAEAIENILFIGDSERPARIEARACFKAMMNAEDQDHE